MIGVSLKNPFANLIALQYKSIETRTAASPVAKMKHRGEILICTSASEHEQWNYIKQHYLFSMQYVPIDSYMKKATDILWEQCNHEWSKFSQLLLMPIKQPSIVAIAEVYAITDMIAEHQDAACYSVFNKGKSMMLRNIRKVSPVPLKGLTNGFHLGPFEVNIHKHQLIII